LKGTQIAIIVSVVGSVILLGTIFFLWRLKSSIRERRRQLVNSKLELHPVISPIVAKEMNPDPFMTDLQAQGLGYDLERQPTRRIEAQFSPLAQAPRDRRPPQIALSTFKGGSSTFSGSFSDESMAAYLTQPPELGFATPQDIPRDRDMADMRLDTPATPDGQRMQELLAQLQTREAGSGRPSPNSSSIFDQEDSKFTAM